jgi:6-phosphogluconolactonase
VFAVDRRGDLSLIQRIRSGGERPWHFAIHPGGRWLLVANRDSNDLRLFRIDPRSGRLEDIGRALASPSPVHVCFLRA